MLIVKSKPLLPSIQSGHHMISSWLWRRKRRKGTPSLSPSPARRAASPMRSASPPSRSASTTPSPLPYLYNTHGSGHEGAEIQRHLHGASRDLRQMSRSRRESWVRMSWRGRGCSSWSSCRRMIRMVQFLDVWGGWLRLSDEDILATLKSNCQNCSFVRQLSFPLLSYLNPLTEGLFRIVILDNLGKAFLWGLCQVELIYTWICEVFAIKWWSRYI